MLALSEGRLPIEAVRVTDVSTNEFMDIRDVPDIVVDA